MSCPFCQLCVKGKRKRKVVRPGVEASSAQPGRLLRDRPARAWRY
jgi:hypothetical protein